MTLRKASLLSIGAIIVFLILYVTTSVGLFGDNPIGQSSPYNTPLIVPAGYAFSIWSVIYIGLIAFPIFQYFKSSDRLPVWTSFHPWFVANVILNGLWLVFASYNWQWLTVITIILMLYSLVRMNDLLFLFQKQQRVNFWLEVGVFKIYFAWITLATALNVSTALHQMSWNGWGQSQVTWTLLISLVAAAIAGYVSWKYRSSSYALVVTWAFIALMTKQLGEISSIAYVSAGIAIAFLFIALFIGRKTAGSSVAPV